MNTFTTETPDVITKLMAEVDNLFDNTDVFEIITQADFDYAVELLASMKGDVKKIDAAKKELTKPLNDCKTEIIARFKPFLERCDFIEGKFKVSMRDFLKEKQRIARQQQAAADERARKERERLERQAQTAINNGKVEKAEVLIVQADAVSSVGAIAAPVKTKGTSQTTVYDFRLLSKKEFIQGVANGLIPLNSVDINETMLKKHIKMNEGEVDYPGIEITDRIQLGIKAAS